jgi:hypothetical protein
MVATIIVSTILLGKPKNHAKAPAWLDFMLAGYALEYDEKHGEVGVYDQWKGFYLTRVPECDGGILSVTLTRDRALVSNDGFNVPGYGQDRGPEAPKVIPKALPSLSTGKGVKIGDNQSQVKKLLGPPTREQFSGSRDQFVDLVYSWKSGKGGEGAEYDETYTFKQGKLIEVIFLRVSNAA